MKGDRNGLPPSPELIAALIAAADRFCEIAGITLSTLGKWISKDPQLFDRRMKGDVHFSTYEKARKWLEKHKATPNMRGRRPDAE